VEGDGAKGVVRPFTQHDGAATGQKVRVLFVMIQMAMGGSERLIFNLVRNLDRRRFEPSIAWFASERPLREFEDLQVPLHYVPKRRRIDWSTMRRLAAIIREQRIDVVNAHHFLPFFYAYYGAKVANRARLVYTEHSQADVLNIPRKWHAIARYMLRSSDGAIGISDGVARRLESHLGLEPRSVHTIENGVDVALFGGAAHARPAVRQRLGLSPTEIVIGHVANFRRNKNHMFLLRAFREVIRTRPNMKLLFIGTGAEGDPENSEPEVARFIETSGLADSVRMLGYRADVQELLGALDVFCLVSYKEGLPLSLIEAMASGLPVIGTDIEGIRAVIEPGTSGLLVAPDDVAGLTSTLSRLADNTALRREMGDAGRHAAQTKYSLARCLEQTQDLFVSVAADRIAPLRAYDSPAA
jgi:glycosyltransferase involved in cell wall biosynthesis